MGVLAALATFTTGLAALLPASEAGNGGPSAWFVVLAAITLGGSALIIACIVLFNWPRAVVPPHLRADRGAVYEWLRSAKSEHQQHGDQ